jgi:cardiolipin synthase
MPATTLRIEALLSLHGLITFAALLIYVSFTRAQHQRRYPSAAIGWVISLLLIPYLALPLFLLFGTRKLVHNPRQRTKPTTGALRELPWPQALAASMQLAAAVPYRDLSIHADGAAALAALREVIEGAARTLDVCTFILGRDPLGQEIGDALIRKARAGIRVRLLLDGVGRWMSGRADFGHFRAAGVEVAIFVPLIHSPFRGRLNLRNHRKMVIADDQRLWTGGRNLAAEYFVGDRASAAWRDLTYDCRGELVGAASALFAGDWTFATDGRTTGADAVDAASADGAAAASAGAVRTCAQLIPSGPDQSDDTVLSMLVTASFRARQRIVAVTPYFVPDESLSSALSLAARRGVAVDLVIPARSNHRMADIARHRPLRELVRSGCRVWMLPQMIHAKGFVADDAIAFAGSANLDARSLFLNYEMMVAFYAPDDVRRFVAWIDTQRRDATRYVAQPPGAVRDMAEGLVLALAFQM